MQPPSLLSFLFVIRESAVRQGGNVVFQMRMPLCFGGWHLKRDGNNSLHAGKIVLTCSHKMRIFCHFAWIFGVMRIWGISALEKAETSGLKGFQTQMSHLRGDARGRARNERGRARTCEELRRFARGRARNERGRARTSEDVRGTQAIRARTSEERARILAKRLQLPKSP